MDIRLLASTALARLPVPPMVVPRFDAITADGTLIELKTSNSGPKLYDFQREYYERLMARFA